MTKGWSAYVIDVGVAYKEDTDQVVDIMKGVAGTLRKDPRSSNGPSAASIVDDSRRRSTPTASRSRSRIALLHGRRQRPARGDGAHRAHSAGS
jgi:small-conductance mechanosensitive channel